MLRASEADLWAQVEPAARAAGGFVAFQPEPALRRVRLPQATAVAPTAPIKALVPADADTLLSHLCIVEDADKLLYAARDAMEVLAAETSDRVFRAKAESVVLEAQALRAVLMRSYARRGQLHADHIEAAVKIVVNAKDLLRQHTYEFRNAAVSAADLALHQAMSELLSQPACRVAPKRRFSWWLLGLGVIGLGLVIWTEGGLARR